MSPLGKGTLKVQTIVGDKTYTDEEHRNELYRRNDQSKPQRQAGSHPMDMKAFGHTKPPVEEFEMPEDMAKVIANDLTNKGVAPAPKKRTPKKKTTTSD